MAVKTFTDNTSLPASDINTYLTNSGLVYIKQQTVGTTVTSVTVTDAFSSTYDNYKIIYSGGLGSTLISLQVSLGASTTGYYAIVAYSNYTTAATPASGGDNNANRWGNVGYASADYSSMNFDLIGPNLAKYTTYGTAAWAAVTVAGNSSGIHQVATAYTSFTTYANTGTISGGTIYVYGYRKA